MQMQSQVCTLLAVGTRLSSRVRGNGNVKIAHLRERERRYGVHFQFG